MPRGAGSPRPGSRSPREAAWAARSRPAARSRSWQGRVGKQEREPRSSSPRGESCGSRREACEYTQTLWSLPCKSWQDAASSELIHVRSPHRLVRATRVGRCRELRGTCPGGCPPLSGAARRAQPIQPLSLQVPLPAAPCPCGHRQRSPASADSWQERAVTPGSWLWSWPWHVGHWGIAGVTLGMSPGTGDGRSGTGHQL